MCLKFISKLFIAISKSSSGLGMICTLHLNLFCENAFSKYKSQNYKSCKWEDGGKVAQEICKKKKIFLLLYELFQGNNNSYLFPYHSSVM